MKKVLLDLSEVMTVDNLLFGDYIGVKSSENMKLMSQYYITPGEEFIGMLFRSGSELFDSPTETIILARLNKDVIPE